MVLPTRNLWRFYRRRPLTFSAVASDDGIKEIKTANIDWYLMRVCVSEPPLAKYIELCDGTYTINDLADMHETLDEMDEYRRRYDAKNK